MKTSELRGVNLGGWLVLERWITPSLFEGVTGSDEYSFCQQLAPFEARKRLSKHRRTFITKQHLRQIKAIGLNAVRLPVGYWLFEDEDGLVGGAYRYVDRLFQWANELDLKVILSLHGAPGSQNGWDHSGREGEIGWLHRGRYTQKTLHILEKITKQYGQEASLYGIELLNEPHSTIPISWLISYYKPASRLIRNYCHQHTRCIVSDAFRPRTMIWYIWLVWLSHPVVDQHLYQLFTPDDRKLDLLGHFAKAGIWMRQLRWRRKFVNIIVGEWSVAMDELYDPVLKISARNYTYYDYLSYAGVQRKAFEAAGCGWFYWTARTEDGGVWSLLDHPDFVA